VAVVKEKRVESAALRVTYGHLSRPEILTIRLPSLPNYGGLWCWAFMSVPSESLRESPSPHNTNSLC